MSRYGISFKGNPEQEELARLIEEHNKKIIFVEGDAGTGKTFTTLATALELVVHSKSYSKIIYGRNPIQIGEDMGFLPGDMEEKYNPFMGPLMDNLENIVKIKQNKTGDNRKQLKMLRMGEVNELLNGTIEVQPIAFLRGRSIDDAIVIIDEAQNLDLVALRTILTRIGEYSKVILLGSMNQIDDYKQRKKEVCDFQKVIDLIGDWDICGHVKLIKSMRSEWCTRIDKALTALDKPHKITCTWSDGQEEVVAHVNLDKTK